MLNDDALELCLVNAGNWEAENPSVELVAGQLDKNKVLKKSGSFKDMSRSII